MPQYEYACRNCGKKFTEMLTLAEYDKKKNSMQCPTLRQYENRASVGGFRRCRVEEELGMKKPAVRRAGL